ncbi:MAG: amidohydrolase family protein, partial [Vicinamibacteria bacterium]
MTAETVYRAAWVLPVTSPAIRDGFVSVREGVITGVGSISDRPAGADVREVDLGAAILMPGFVNAHTHLELSHLGSGAVPGDRGFVPWIEDQLRVRAERSPEEATDGIRQAIASLEASGTSAVADVSNSLAAVDALAQSSLHGLVLHEIIGFDPARAEAIVQQTTAMRAGISAPDHGRVRVEVAAHAPHSISRELFALLMANGGVKSIHVAESKAE